MTEHRLPVKQLVILCKSLEPKVACALGIAMADLLLCSNMPLFRAHRLDVCLSICARAHGIVWHSSKRYCALGWHFVVDLLPLPGVYGTLLGRGVGPLWQKTHYIIWPVQHHVDYAALGVFG